MSRRVSKPKPLAEWQINRVAKVAKNLGTVRARDADAAIRAAIEKFDIDPQHHDRIAARRIVKVPA